MQPHPPTEATLISPVVDLRQYTLYPGMRDRFVELFDTQFVETQEEVGIRLIGQFRDLGDPNRFVWLRGYADMPSRERALRAFYLEGQAWKDHAPAARSMMIDSSDVLMLKPLDTDSALGGNRQWGREVYPALTRQLSMPPQLLRLSPTSRSQLR